MCCDGFSFGSCEELAIVRVQRCGFRKGLRVCDEFVFGTAGFRNLISLLFARIFGSQYAPFVVVNGANFLFIYLFLFLVCFVILQVITKGSSWVGFNDGAQSQLLNENFSCVVWIMVLQRDWQEDLWGAKGQGWEEYIWCWLKSTKQKLFVMKRS